MTETADRSVLEALRAAAVPVEALLDRFVAERRAELVAIDPVLDDVAAEVQRLIDAGGKRLRPAFVYWGHQAAGEEPGPPAIHVGAAVEMLHTFALIHDDIMDRSSVRRGEPTAFRALADAHRDAGRHGDSEWFGVSAGVLVGDLVHVWAEQLFDATPASPEALARARDVYTTLRVEVMAGQYLELELAARTGATADEARRVALLKSGRYTVTRPLHLGAALAGGEPTVFTALSEYGDAIGLAFQLRDDLLGLVGDTRLTGKGLDDDVREGKRTMLVLRAIELAEGDDRRFLARSLGDGGLAASDIERCRSIIVASGAVESIEQTIGELHARAVSALGPVDASAATALRGLADLIVHRTS